MVANQEDLTCQNEVRPILAWGRYASKAGLSSLPGGRELAWKCQRRAHTSVLPHALSGPALIPTRNPLSTTSKLKAEVKSLPFHASSLSSSAGEPLQGDFLPRYHHSPPAKQTSPNLTVGHLKFERRKENRRRAAAPFVTTWIALKLGGARAVGRIPNSDRCSSIERRH